MSVISNTRESFHDEFNEWWKSDKNIWKTHKRFAQHVGISESSIGDYLNGRSVPTGERAIKLYNATGLDNLKPSSRSFMDYSREATNSPDNTQTTDIPSDELQQGSLLSPEEPDVEPYKTFRIGVSGDVILRNIECAIVDTRMFQRLRSIKQLGTSYLVYPSATHTRFEHSIGTLYEADRMIQCIKTNPKSLPNQKWISGWDEQIIRLAALLHDIGHIPFGHTLEDETLVVEMQHDNDASRRDTLLVDSPIGEILKRYVGNDLFNLLMRIISTSHKDVGKLGEHAFIADIVNNTLCADLLDYLKRDVYFCNLQDSFGDRFMKYLYLDEVPNPETLVSEGAPPKARRLIIRLWKKDSSKHRRDVLSELTDLLRTRYTLGEKVYFHHAKASSSAMIARAVWSDIRNSVRPHLSIQRLYTMGDDELLNYLSNSSDVAAQMLGNRLRKRQLHKMAYSLTRSEAEAATGLDWTGKMISEYHDDPENRTRVEDQIASLCELEPGEVLIYCPDRDMGKKYAGMLVEWKGDYRILRDIDDPATRPSLLAIEKSHELLWNLQVFVSSSAKQNEKCMRTLLDLCESKFWPFKNPQDGERRFESALRNIVNEKIGSGGTSANADEVVSNLISVNRGGSELITLPDISNAIKEIIDS